MRVFHVADYPLPLPTQHRFPGEKYALLLRALAADPTLSGLELVAASPVDEAQLLAAHAAPYVHSIRGGEAAPAVMREIGFPWSAELYRRSRASVGATLGAARDALDSGLSGALAGGTHHAHRERGSGFCVFNDAAVTVGVLRAEALIERVAIIDLDVHQGDGNASLLGGDPDTYILDIYGEKNFPFRKVLPLHHVPLPPRTGDDEYLEAVGSSLPRAIDAGLGLVIYNAGVDPLGSDRLGTLDLTMAGLAARDDLVLAACRRAGVPLAITLGGGYAAPIHNSVRAYQQTYRRAFAASTGGEVR